MNEEKIGKSVKTLYIVTYAIFIALGLIWAAFGAMFMCIGDEDLTLLGGLFIFTGVIVIALSVFWLVYFIKMPEYSITYKDGKLYFRKKLECTPAQLEYVLARDGWFDGAIFNFGRIVVYVGGKKYNFRYIQDVQYVANRLLQLKNGVGMQTSVFGNTYAPAPQTEVTESTEPVAEQPESAEPVAEQPESAEPVAEQPETPEKEDNNG